MKIVNRNHISTHISFIIFMGFPLDDANNMKIHVLCTNSSLASPIKICGGSGFGSEIKFFKGTTTVFLCFAKFDDISYT